MPAAVAISPVTRAQIAQTRKRIADLREENSRLRERIARKQNQRAATPAASRAAPALDNLSRPELFALRQKIDQLLGDTLASAPAINAGYRAAPPTKGAIVEVFGADPSRRYQLRYELRDLGDLVASNTASGAINPAYPAELQPRDRTRLASKQQIEQMAQHLEPEALTNEFRALDRGAPIIGEDGVVESGNGRTLALRRAAQSHPEQFAAYRAQVEQAAAGYGLDPAAVRGFRQPVLVRVRLDDVDRAAFAAEANTATVLTMSDTERAKTDAARISAGDLLLFESTDDIDTDLRRTANREFVRAFVAALPDTERAQLMGRDGELTQAGIKRIKAAMFTRVYADPRLCDRIFENPDNDIRNVTNGLMASLGAVARAEELVRSGQRAADLTLAHDLTAAVGQLAALKESGLSVESYLGQTSLFGDDLTGAQKQILQALHERRRSGKAITEFLGAWANLVEQQPHPAQLGMFGDQGATKDELLARWLKSEGQPQGKLL